MSEVYSDLVYALVNISAGGLIILTLAILLCRLKHLFSSHFRKTALFVSMASLVFMLCISFTIQILRIPTPKPLFPLKESKAFSQALNQNSGAHSSGGGKYAEESAKTCSLSVYGMGNNMTDAAPGWLKSAVLLWGSGTFLSALFLLLGLRNASRIRRASYPVTEPSIMDLLAELKKDACMDRHVEVLRNDSVYSPLTFGFRKPVIILPGEAEGWSPECLRVVLLHELLHIKRRDPFTNLFIRIVCVLFWFNPIVWIASRRYRFIQEASCDDRVLEMGVSPYFYAKELVRLTFFYKHLKPRFTLSNSLYGKSTTVKRVAEILEPKKIKYSVRHSNISYLILIVFVISISFSFVSFVGATTETAAGISGPMDTPDLWPVLDGSGTISSHFGDMMPGNGKSGSTNRGIDISSIAAMPVVASANGEVAKTGSNSALIVHKGGLSTFYGNLCIVSVSCGQSVTKGQLIGYCYTGLIHFEIARDEIPLDPVTILNPR